MKQKFESILAEVSGKYIDVKPYLAPTSEWSSEYLFPNKELWEQVTEVSKHEINKDHLKCLRREGIVFVESVCQKNQEFNDFIDDNYNEIYNFCGYNLQHKFSSVNRVVSKIDEEQINYFRPYATNLEYFARFHTAPVIERMWYDSIRDNLKLDDSQPIRGLMVFDYNDFLYYPINGNSGQELIFNFMRALFLAQPNKPRDGELYVVDYLGPCPEIAIADEKCRPEFNELLEEVQEKINRMEGLGVDRAIILSLLDLPNLSCMVITADYRIFLPDFKNVEILMPPLAKTLYIFYLKHPQGLFFRELRDYRQELMQIYMAISNRENCDDMESSIDALIDSTQNSVNENRSRIRSAFLKEFCDSIASQYYITGYGRDAKKYIEIDRDRVIFQCEI